MTAGVVWSDGLVMVAVRCGFGREVCLHTNLLVKERRFSGPAPDADTPELTTAISLLLPPETKDD